MTVLAIRRFDDKILLQEAEPVSQDEFGEDLIAIMSSMAETMYSNQGVGLAGPQVGFLKRVLVTDVGYTESNQYGGGWLGMVNPEILESSEEVDTSEEGCLSFPSFTQKVERAHTVRVKFFSPTGEVQEREFEGFQARVIQHEIDHLNGITLLSRAGTLKRKNYMKKINKVRKAIRKTRG
jgi:peptide deformylase